MNDQVSSYIRGQLTVAFAVAIMFMIGFADYWFGLCSYSRIVAGFLNLYSLSRIILSNDSSSVFSNRCRASDVSEAADRLCFGSKQSKGV